MSLITDSIMELYFYFRLGNQPIVDSMCLHLAQPEGNPVIIGREDLPQKKSGMTRFVIISDTHERHTNLGLIPPGDIFIHCGDILMTNSKVSHESGRRKLENFNEWLERVPCKEKIVIGGNHDHIIEHLGPQQTQDVLSHAIYLENSSITIDSHKIWGTPLSHGHSHNTAFQSNAFKKRTYHEASLNLDSDVIISHGPNFELLNEVFAQKPPKLHIWGHAHGAYGVRKPGESIWGYTMRNISVNASIMNTSYNPHNHPVVIDIPASK